MDNTHRYVTKMLKSASYCTINLFLSLLAEERGALHWKCTLAILHSHIYRYYCPLMWATLLKVKFKLLKKKKSTLNSVSVSKCHVSYSVMLPSSSTVSSLAQTFVAVFFSFQECWGQCLKCGQAASNWALQRRLGSSRRRSSHFGWSLCKCWSMCPPGCSKERCRRCWSPQSPDRAAGGSGRNLHSPHLKYSTAQNWVKERQSIRCRWQEQTDSKNQLSPWNV